MSRCGCSGRRVGLPLSGLASGFVSSAATVAAMGQRAAKTPTLRRAAVAGAVLSTVATFVQMVVVLAATSPATLAGLRLPLLFGGAAAVAYGLVFTLHLARGSVDGPVPRGRAFDLKVSLLFAATVSGVLLASAAINQWLGARGLLAAVALAGFADAHAAAISAASLVAAGKIQAADAIVPILAGMTTNTGDQGGRRGCDGRPELRDEDDSRADPGHPRRVGRRFRGGEIAAALAHPSGEPLQTAGSERLAGLSEEEASARLRREGYDELPSARKGSVLVIAWEVVREPMILLLLTTATIYLLLGDRREAMVLLSSVFVVIGISLYQNHQTERALAALRELASPRALVLRGGVRRRIPGREVVRGDVLLLSEGDRVPADATLLEASSLAADESLLTGESVPVRKVASPGGEGRGPTGRRRPALRLFGDPSGFGMRDRPHGRDRSSHSDRPDRAVAPDHRCGEDASSEGDRPNRAADRRRCHGALCGDRRSLRDGARELARRLSRRPRAGDGDPARGVSRRPDRLSALWAPGASRTRTVLTRRLPAIESLGAATVLCVDKTGTLTQNRMSVRKLWAGATCARCRTRWDSLSPKASASVIEVGVLASRSGSLRSDGAGHSKRRPARFRTRGAPTTGISFASIRSRRSFWP